MAISHSNSGVLRAIGDTVALERKPTDDAVGVQLHGDADGVELVFEGNMAGAIYPLPSKPLAESIQPKPDGRFSYIVSALHCTRVLVRLVGLKSGSLHLVLCSGNAEAMEALTKAHAADQVKPVKLGQAKPKS